MKTREEKEKFLTDTANYIKNYEQRWREIKGHAVNYPHEYLIEEDLNTNFLNQEMLVPEIAFVWLW